jgi:hypothetical protein
VSPKYFLTLRFHYQNPVYATCPAHLINIFNTRKKNTASNWTLFSCSENRRKCSENFPFINSAIMSVLIAKLFRLAVRGQLTSTS